LDTVVLNFWVPAAFKTPILLGGYWGDYPSVQTAFVIESVFQAIIAIIAMSIIFWQLYKHNMLNAEWSLFILPHHYPLGTFVIIPLLYCAWELVLAGMHLGLVYAWFSAPSMASVYLHAQIEWYLVVVRILVLTKDEWSSKMSAGLIWASIALTVITFLTFLTTSSPVVQGSLAGTAFGTDFTLFFLTPIFYLRSIAKLKQINVNEATISEILVTVLSFNHILQYYVPIAAVSISDSYSIIGFAGCWIMVFSWINLGLYIAYMIFNFKTMSIVYAKHHDGALLALEAIP